MIKKLIKLIFLININVILLMFILELVYYYNLYS